MFYLSSDLPEIRFPVVKVENLYCEFFSCFTEPILQSQQLIGVEKNSVAISLMLNHNLTGLFGIETTNTIIHSRVTGFSITVLLK